MSKSGMGLVRRFVRVGGRGTEILAVLMIAGGVNILTGVLSDTHDALERSVAAVLLIYSGVQFFLVSSSLYAYLARGEEIRRTKPIDNQQPRIYYAIQAIEEDDLESGRDGRKLYEKDYSRIRRALLATLLSVLVLLLSLFSPLERISSNESINSSSGTVKEDTLSSSSPADTKKLTGDDKTK